MSCLSETKLSHFVNRQVTVEESESVHNHVQHCPRCAAVVASYERVVDSIAPLDHEFKDELLERQILANLDRESPRASRSLWRWLLPVGVPALVAAALVLAVLTPPADLEFRARGANVDLDRWVSFQGFVRGSTDAYDPIGDSLPQDARISFSVRNLPESPHRFVMILGIDTHSEVYWYYPESDAGVSLAIAPGEQAHTLADEVQHALPKGEYALLALFSPQPLSAAEVEQKIKHRLAAGENASQIRFDGVGRQLQRVTVWGP